VVVAGAFAIARRQSLEDGERFWSPPTLRVTQARLPPLAAGLILSLVLVVSAPGASAFADHALMGGVFGVAHLAYGAYLFMTEPRKTPA
jgi:hypothetical protein